MKLQLFSVLLVTTLSLLLHNFQTTASPDDGDAKVDNPDENTNKTTSEPGKFDTGTSNDATNKIDDSASATSVQNNNTTFAQDINKTETGNDNATLSSGDTSRNVSESGHAAGDENRRVTNEEHVEEIDGNDNSTNTENFNETNENAKATNENTNATNENANATSENSKATNENSNATNEKTDLTNENANATVEKDNATNEKTDLTNENANATDEKANSRIEKANATNEYANATNENAGETNAKANPTNENTTATNKKANSSNDNANSTNEKAITTNENANTTNENANATNEKVTATNENANATNETTNVTHENTNAANEKANSTYENGTTNESYSTPGRENGTTPATSTKTKGVSGECFSLYGSCTEPFRDEDDDDDYCQILVSAEPCIQQGNTDNNTTEFCTDEEMYRIHQIDCGPTQFFNLSTNKSGSEIGPVCLRQISDCLSVSKDAEKLCPSYTFRQLFCDVVKCEPSCFFVGHTRASCTKEEGEAAIKLAGCPSGSAPPITASICFLFLASLLQRMLGSG